MLTVIVVVLVLFALLGGGLGQRRYGYAGWSPLGVILLLVGVLYFTGHIFH